MSLSVNRWAEPTHDQLDSLLYRVHSIKGLPELDNAIVESFNGRLRQECLNEHWFMSLEDAQHKIEAWRAHYNESRPHSALDWWTPHEFALQHGLKPVLQGKQRAEIPNL